MTFRPNDTETSFTPSAPVRNLRRRRRFSAIGHSVAGASLTGFGI